MKIPINKSSKTLIIVVLILVYLLINVYKTRIHDNSMHIFFLDVGQGDAIFITTPSGKQILIDGGPDKSVLHELSDVIPFYDRSIDMIIATHSDSDHISGLIDVLKRYEIKTIIENSDLCDSVLCDTWNQAVENENAVHKYVYTGYKINIDPDTIMSVIWPMEPGQGINQFSDNDGSIVLILNYQDQKIMLTGDIEKSAEEKIIANNYDIDVDFLKIGHHGSKTSSTEDFLEKVSPILAFIQVGKENPYHHPHKTVTERLAKMNIPYYRTDIHGRIELILDGQNYKVRSAKSEIRN